jgi:DNA helicase II / ATP-dependent DNA helicase PcrA
MMNLNRYQKEAVTHVDGPCLVTSCPGSGKTLTLVERVIYLINQGIKPKNILCLTFTNKAANEMKERIAKKANISDPKFFIGTFHSLCARMIRKIGAGRGYGVNFNILDDKDQIDLILQIGRRLEYNIEKGDAYKIANHVNYYRDQMEDFEWVEDSLKSDPLIEIAEEYLSRCRSHNLLDFSGLIYETIKIMEEDEDLRGKIQHTFKYIMVDETQDTNKSQFHLVNLLGAKWKNIMLIGDIDQCIREGEKVSTSSGFKNIENIKKGDSILAAGGSGKILEAEVKETYKKMVVDYDMIKVITKDKKILTFSKEHMIFAGYAKNSPKKIVVYLMYDKKYGYRVGVTNTKRSNGSGGYGIGARLSQERADYMWILKAVDSIDDAKYWEQYYSVKYGIPTWCFYSNKTGRKLDYSDKSIKKLFTSIDTEKNAANLMNDLWLFGDRPHYVPKCKCKNKRRNFTINMCADSRQGTLHRYMISGSDNNDRKQLINAGLKVRDAGKGRRGWRVDSAFKSLGDVYEILRSVENCFSVNVIEKARLGEESLSLIPGSHLREGMAVYVEKNGKIELDYVDKVLQIKYTGYLYDLDVKRYHNFITNGIVSHNSVYGWRGARYQNIQDFINNYEDCRVISLSKNYRSTPQIVNVASKLIKYNSSHMGVRFETDNANGEVVQCFSFVDQMREASWVGKTIRRFIDEGGWAANDIAVLYRANKMSEPIEQVLVSNEVPYEVIGAWNFYDRKEVRDCVAMLKLLANPRDGIAFNRVCSLVKGMGNVTIGKIENLAQEKNITIPQACKEISSSAKSISMIKSCEKISSIYNSQWDHKNPAKCLKKLVEGFDYNKYLMTKFGNSATERGDNITQLVDAAGECNGEDNGVSKYLQKISLITNADKEVKEDRVSLMSIHASKGLEFPIVFMIGVEDGILPHKMAIADDPYAGLEEERRLAYVAATRAKQILLISYCKNRKRFGKYGNMTNNKSNPSQFLYEMGLLEKQ